MSGQLLNDRKVKVTVAPPVNGNYRTAKTQQAMVVTDLRVRFKVSRNLRKEPNPGELVIYNLSEDSRKQLQGKGARVWLEAGYAETVSQIFVGDVRYIDHKRDGADWITKLELGDGERAYAHARVNESFKSGTSKADILKKLIEQCGWDPGNASSFYADLGGVQAVNGAALVGNAAREIDKLLRSRGLTYSVQDGTVQILPATGYVPSVAVQLDSSHGLIGSPEVGSPDKKDGHRTLKVTSLLQPELMPGRKVYLQAATVTGTYVVQKLEHTGDTFGGEFYTTLEVIPA